jgi:hypothetical protein
MREAATGKTQPQRTEEILIRGKSWRYESAGEYSLRCSASGKFLLKHHGPLTETDGFNGSTSWTLDLTGMPRTLELSDRDHNQLWVGLQTGLWLAQIAPEAISPVPEESDREVVVLNIRQGRLGAKLHVNRKTWLPVLLLPQDMACRGSWRFSDYRDQLGWKLPGKISVTLGGGMSHNFQVDSVQPAPPTEAGVYDPITNRPQDTQFTPAIISPIKVKRAPTGHVLVRPKINGQDLGWFIFDTGAGGATILHSGALAKLKLSPLGALPVSSFLGSSRSRLLRGESLQLGPLTIMEPLFTEMDLGFLRTPLAEEIMGIVGYDVLSRCVAEIRLAKDDIRLHDPKHFALDTSLWQKLTLDRGLPTVPATFEGGHKGRFRIDVGAAAPGFSNVAFHAPAVEALNLLSRRQVTIARLGVTRIAFGKMAWFELAGQRFEKPDVVFALDRQGPFGDEYLEGNLGVEFLKPFRIVLDYAHERVVFLKSTT